MASQNASLPPDQSLRIYTQNQRLVILSVAESGLSIGKDTGYPTFEHTDFTNGVYLFTEKLSVTSDIVAPYGLTAATWTLIGPENRVELNATGIRGQTGTGGSPNGQPGGPGGTLGLYVQDLDDTAAKTFTLLARGGGGGDTYDSKAKVGDGGDGGVIANVLQPTYLRILKYVQQYLARAEFQDLDDRASIVPKTDSLYLVAKHLVDAGQDLSASEETITNVFGRLRDEVAKIESGNEATVENLRSAANFANYTLSQLIKAQENTVVLSPDDVRGGYPGTGINVEVDEGTSGKDGELRPTFLKDALSIPDSLAKARLAFAHPEQCGMLLERANIFFYLGSSTLRDRARALYRRLIERLSFLSVLQPSDLLYQAYQESGIMPSTWFSDLKRVWESASTMLVKLNSGSADYYGYSLRWVPRASYTFYKDFLDDALANFQSFENAYIQYNDALQQQIDLNDSIKLAYDKTSQMVSSLSKDRDDLWSGVQDLDRRITAMKFTVEKAHQELIDAYEAELARIRPAFGLSIPQLLNAFTSIAFTPKFGLEMVELVYKGFTSVPTIDGGTVQGEYLASEISQSEATIANISLQLQKKIDGTYELDEAFTNRLLVEKEQILSQLNKFSSTALGGINDADTRKDLEEKFDAFIDIVTQRNDLIFQYNVKVSLLQEKTDEQAEYVEKQKELENRQVKNNDPDLPVITAYVEAIYQSSRERVMKLLEILLRSLKFRMLDSQTVVAFAFGHDDPEPDSVPLSLTYTVLLMARGNIQDQFSKEIEKWGSEPIRFPSDYDNPTTYVRGKRYYLNDVDRVQLISSGTVVLTIPPVFQHTMPAGDFGGSCNVRVYRARFGFTGLKTTGGVQDGVDVRVQAQMTHGGNESIINRSNEEILFEHDRISTIFSFYLRNDGSMTVEQDGNIAYADINNTATSYAAPGPFAEWTVDLNHTEFDKLDFSEVTEAFFDFCGTNYAF